MATPAHNLILSPEEIAGITRSRQRKVQCRELDAIGIPYRKNSEGWPIVGRRAAERVLDSDDSTPDATLDLDWLYGEEKA